MSDTNDLPDDLTDDERTMLSLLNKLGPIEIDGVEVTLTDKGRAALEAEPPPS